MMTPSPSLQRFLDEEGLGGEAIVNRAAQAQVTDGASTALKVAQILVKHRLEVLHQSSRYQNAAPERQRIMDEWIIFTCQSHGLQNTSLIIPVALDAFEKDVVGELQHASGAHHAVAGSAEVAGAEDGFMRCIYSFWKVSNSSVLISTPKPGTQTLFF